MIKKLHRREYDWLDDDQERLMFLYQNQDLIQGKA